MIISEFSIQLYSTRREIWREGLPSVMEKLARIGYAGVEFAGYGDLPVDEMASMLQKNGLKPVGAHIGLDRLEWAFDEEIAYHRTLGTTFLIIPAAPFANAEEVKQTAARLNALAPRVRESGFRFAFHNHGVEFERDGAQYRLEDMMALSPETEIQLDVFWASKMGCDCVEFIKKHAGRICSLHIKQRDAAGESVDLGDGTLDFKALIQAGLETGVNCFVHEQEEFPGCAYESLGNGFRHIMSL
ncbi:MAG: sugar phosphate isomerase/epimerase [Oscillospiraceae bacterium]|nr:sugar phosphate isomerase/epimerase [Oscillospiraceae bacterium]